jgi:6-pyruvoyl-tetrahydropterin synthase related domain
MGARDCGGGRLDSVFSAEQPLRSLNLKQVVIETVRQPLRAAVTSRALAAFVCVALAATAVISPMPFRGNASGHDFPFHLASWMEAAGQWRHGIIYPRWAEWANWGFGEPRFIFYPPASWILGGALGSVLPWKMAPAAFIWLALVAAGLSMHTLGREWLSTPQAIAAAVLYTANPYALVMVYYRSAFGELIATALLPLLIWAALHVLRQEWQWLPALAAAFAAIWLSDAPAAVIATYSLVLMTLIACMLQRSPRPLLSSASAAVLGFGLAAFYVVPAAWEQRWVQIAQAATDELIPAKNFLFTHSNDHSFVVFNWKVSAVALGMTLVTIAALVLVARKRRDLRDIRWMLLALGGASVLMMLSISQILWDHLPELRFEQFPWRWLGVLAVVFAFFTAAAIDFSRKRAAWIASVALVAALGTAAALMIKDASWDDQDAPAIASAIRSGRGYEGVDEYAPLGCDRDGLPGNPDDTTRPADVPSTPAPLVSAFDPETDEIAAGSPTTIHVERWSAEQKTLAVNAPSASVLALRLLNYPAWKARVDGVTSRLSSRSDTAQMLISVPAGEHQVEIRFRRTWDRKLGDDISILSLFALAAFWVALCVRRSPTPISGG